jgi:hypothetical protein
MPKAGRGHEGARFRRGYWMGPVCDPLAGLACWGKRGAGVQIFGAVGRKLERVRHRGQSLSLGVGYRRNVM